MKTLIIFLILSFQTQAFIQLERPIKNSNFNFMLEHLQKYPPLKREHMFQVFKKLNEQTEYLSNKTLEHLIQEGIELTLLNNSLIQNNPSFIVSSSIIKNCEKKLKQNRDLYTPFVTEFMNRIMKDYRNFFIAGFINRYQNFNRANPKEVAMYQNIKKLILRTSNWIESFINFPAKDFNNIVTKVSLEALENIELKALFYTRYTKNIAQGQSLFKIDSPNSSKTNADPETISKEIDNIILKSE